MVLWHDGNKPIQHAHWVFIFGGTWRYEEIIGVLLLQIECLNPFPHDKILDQTRLKTFADDKLNVTKMIISVFDRVENIVGKGEIARTSNFSFFHNVFKRLFSQRRQKVSLFGNELTLSQTNPAF